MGMGNLHVSRRFDRMVGRQTVGQHTLVRAAFCLAAVTMASVTAPACDEEKRRPNGSACDTSAQCGSGLCLGGSCLDPLADEDQDGLINQIEGNLGSNVNAVDSDGDGIPDPDEVTADLQLIDTDGDGKPDVIESATRDADGDCVTDQFDADDAVPTDDPSPMLPVVCDLRGICAASDAGLRVVCDDTGVAQCDYSGVTGYANPETICDGVDENCDGRADEAFPGGCAAPVRSGLVGASGGNAVETDRYRAVLTIGPTPLGGVSTSKYKAVIGRPIFNSEAAGSNLPASTEAP
jgi:hypothetical protein